jgi:hypothetical protein
VFLFLVVNYYYYTLPLFVRLKKRGIDRKKKKGENEEKKYLKKKKKKENVEIL